MFPDNPGLSGRHPSERAGGASPPLPLTSGEAARDAAVDPSDSTLRCPVCRARQPLQGTCRRCAADLHLLVAVLREVQRLQEAYRQARQQGDLETAEETAKKLKELAPNAVF